MRTRKIFGPLIALAFLVPDTVMGGDFSEFKKRVKELELKIETTEFHDRYAEFLKARKTLASLKKKGVRDSEQNELSMSLFLEALSDFPNEKISRKKCEEIAEKSSTMNRTSEQETAESVYLLKAKKIVSILCE